MRNRSYKSILKYCRSKQPKDLFRKNLLLAFAAVSFWVMVYLISDEDGIYGKIGVSENPLERLHGIQTASPFPVRISFVIEGNRSTENEIHSLFKNKRRNGEWFIIDSEITEYFKSKPSCPYLHIQSARKEKSIKSAGIKFHSKTPFTNETDFQIDTNIGNNSTKLLRYLFENCTLNEYRSPDGAMVIGRTGLSSNAFYRAIVQLCLSNLLARGDNKWNYYINPQVFFKGDRLVLVQQYIRDENKSAPIKQIKNKK